MTNNNEENHWLRRIDAMGRSQSRYLWILLVTGLFYLSLHRANPETQEFVVPFINLKLDALIIMASGGPVLAFLLLVTLGALRAWKRAVDQYYELTNATGSERLDIHPNALDLAFYTTVKSPKCIRWFTWQLYPLFLSALSAEAWWLLVLTWTNPESPGRIAFVIVGALLLVPATFLVLKLWWSKNRQANKEARD